jgi:hypothetical protein
MSEQRPTLDELRAIVQPASTMSRRNAEHWMARWFLRDVSLRVTALLIRTPVSANQLTGLMIAVGLAAAVPAALAGFWTALLAFALIQAYFLLDLCDGEVARWRRATSVTGVYLDRVGHYLVEAVLLSAYGVRAAGQEWGMWTTLGVVAGLCAILVKAETDLVDVSRARSGLAVLKDAGEGDAADVTVPTSPALAGARKAASVLRIHTLTGALETSFILLLVAGIDAIAGGLTATRVFVGAMVAIAGIMVALHLASILLSRRLS